MTERDPQAVRAAAVAYRATSKKRGQIGYFQSAVGFALTFEEADNLADLLIDLLPAPTEDHVPDRTQVLTSNPPQFYCSNPNCYSHPCDWSGWTKDAPTPDPDEERNT